MTATRFGELLFSFVPVKPSLSRYRLRAISVKCCDLRKQPATGGTQPPASCVPLWPAPRTGTQPAEDLRASCDRTSTSVFTCGYGTRRATCAKWHAPRGERGSVLLSANETTSPAGTPSDALPDGIDTLLAEIASARVTRVRRRRAEIADFRADCQPRRDAAKAKLAALKLARLDTGTPTVATEAATQEKTQ